MKTKFQKFLSVICIFTLLLTSVSGFAIAETADDVSIITAQFLPYEQEIRVLASVPTGYTGKVLVNGEEVASTSSTSGDNTLYTASYTPTVYGIVPVTLEATKDGVTIFDTENVKVVKAFSKTVSLEENFNSLDPAIMSDSTYASYMTDLVADSSAVSITNVSGTKFLDITNTYTEDNSSALTMRFHAAVDSSLPTIKADPQTDGTNGIIELSYDFMSTNAGIRQTIYPVSRAWSSAYTFTTNDNASYSGSFRVVDYITHCFGSTNKPLIENEWYNVRFLMDINALVFEFYVNNELINYGTFTYNSANYVDSYIYGVQRFDLAAGAQGDSFASVENPVNVSFDNIRVTHTNIGAVPNFANYTLSGNTNEANLLNLKIPYLADSFTIGMSNTLSNTDGNISLQKADGTSVDADIVVSDGLPVSAKASRTNITVTPKDNLTLGGEYKLVISNEVKSGSTAYGYNTVIPFKASGVLSILGENISTSAGNPIIANKGDILPLKVCMPDAEYVDLYINSDYVTALAPDANECFAYSYNTSSQSLGMKHIKFVSSNNTLDMYINVIDNITSDILTLEDFNSADDSSYFAIAKQKYASSAATIISEIDGKTAAGFYFVCGGGTNYKAIQISKSISTIRTGRVALEFDLYLTEANKNAQISISFGDGTYTFYPMDVAKQIDSGKISGESKDLSGWNKVKLVMDTIDQSSELYFENVKIGDTCYTLANTYYNKSKYEAPTSITGFKTFTISSWQSEKGTVGNTYLSFAIDNWRVYKEYPIPVINKNIYNDLICASDGVYSYYTTISNSKYADVESLVSNFNFSSEGRILEKETAVYSDGEVVRFSVVNLPENSDLTISLGADTLLYDGVTTIGTDITYNLKVADKNGLYAKKEIATEGNNVKAIYKLDALSEKSLNLIIATYNGNELVDVTVKPVTFANSQNISLTLPKAGTNKAKVFVWANDGIKPVLAGNSEINY